MEICRWLYQHGAEKDILAVDEDLRSPLHACLATPYYSVAYNEKRCIPVLTWLLNMLQPLGSRMKMKILRAADINGKTPFVLAIEKYGVKVLDCLFAAGAIDMGDENDEDGTWPEINGESLFSHSMPDRTRIFGPQIPESSTPMRLTKVHNSIGHGIHDAIFKGLTITGNLERMEANKTSNRDQPTPAAMWLMAHGAFKSARSRRVDHSIVRKELSFFTSNPPSNLLVDTRPKNQRFHDRRRYFLAAIRKEITSTREFAKTFLLGTSSKGRDNESPLRRLSGVEGVLQTIADYAGIVHGYRYQNLYDIEKVLKVYEEPQTVVLSGFTDTEAATSSGFNGEYKQVTGSADGKLRLIDGRPHYVKDMPSTMMLTYSPDASVRIFHLFYRAITDDWCICEKWVSKNDHLNNTHQQFLEVRLPSFNSLPTASCKTHVLEAQCVMRPEGFLNIPDRSHPWDRFARWRVANNYGVPLTPKETLHFPVRSDASDSEDEDDEDDEDEESSSEFPGGGDSSDDDHEYI